ncbi:MAG: hypothetical protein GQ525_06390 [Draconibacterium sp.]|nr:hypothetical protein [Draconibacterium sp.]
MIKTVIKKFGNTNAIWFQQSKSFLLLEEPAFDVFQLFSDEVEKEKISEICQQKYGHLEGNISQFVDEIIEHIQYYSNTDNLDDISSKSLLPDNIQADSFLPLVNYKIGNKQIAVYYGSEYLKFAIHPLIAHLEIEVQKSPKHIIECFEKDNLLIANYNGKIVEAFSTDKVEYFTGGVKPLMYSILYNRGYYDWMSMLHASGIISNNRAILFSAAAGSGKSTISAILKANGFGYLSDDFIATDEAGNAFAFPAAISIKEGSIKVLSEYYPELLTNKTKTTFIGKSVKYIPVFNISEASYKGTPVEAFVFVKFSKTDKYIFEEVDKKEALQLLLKETWVNPKPEIVSSFFNWVERTPFYKLNYSETSQALDAVKEIFNK